jgi:hypothetical protein
MTEHAARVHNARICKALALLLEGDHYARDTCRGVWTYATELKALWAAGLLANDLRWLVCGGYVAHARETTEHAEGDRTFRHTSSLNFNDESCFVLTESGVALAESLAAETRASEGQVHSESFPSGNGEEVKKEVNPPAPTWDPLRRELRVGMQLVKRFRLRSPNQETVLAAFQEESWPAMIDDPLPQSSDQDPKRRLQDTLRGLNRHQVNSLIRFKGDGTGEGILWEWADGQYADNGQ